MKRNFATFFLVFFIFTVLSGCSSHMMSVKYKPTSQTNNYNTQQKLHVGNVVDSRDTPSNWLGAIRGGYGNPIKKLYTDDVTSKVVETAFEDALRNRGLLGPSNESEYKIDVVLNKFDTSYYFNKEAHAQFTVSLVHKPTSKTVFSQTYRTDNTERGAGAGIFGDVDALAAFANDTLNQTIDKALDDPEFLAALKSPLPGTTGAADSIASRMRQLEMLKQDNLITEEEYESRRKILIESL